MAQQRQIEMLARYLRLTPYQAYILEKNSTKYDFRRLVKRGGILYAPYRCDDRRGLAEYCARMLFGPRADLIGADRILASDRRGIRFYPTGFDSKYRGSQSR
jgi:hypothetical protein